ncbi:T9SS type A sorting domain-containing protein, partial [Chryseobacterium sp. SIMBA_028]|uniref:T9SS type A sorting domain-containing protein n=1 Tax=Chryseobacterium sp. SIMBA_028 TaxID=3085771 RepID=UPI00397DDAFB
NPASKKVFIGGLKDKNISAEIISSEGRKVLENAKISSDNSIDITGIPAGVYYINLKSGELKSYSQKLIIK